MTTCQPSPARIYVVDTNVVMSDPQALAKFDEHDVVVPLVVIEELDRHKAGMDDRGRNTRMALRWIEELRAEHGSLSEPVGLPSGGTFRIESNHTDVKLPPYLDPSKADHRILSVAIGLQAVLVTKDTALRIKASQLGVEAQDYRGDTASKPEHWDGFATRNVSPAVIDDMYTNGKVVLDGPGDDELVSNENVVLSAGSQSALGRVASVDETSGLPTVSKVNNQRSVHGVRGKDVRQQFALDLLMDPDIACVSMMGMAGTGKTFMALAAGLEQVVRAKTYRRMSIYRPLVSVGRNEIGYLPGDLDEKLAPWMAAVHDNLYALLGRDGDGPSPRSVDMAVQSMVDRGQLEMAAMTYLRGRSITDEFVIVDEAQNIELSTLKVVMTRMAQGSKVVFCGDLGQTDNPYVSPHGGMAALIDRFRGSPLFGHITLERGIRSPLAEQAAMLF